MQYARNRIVVIGAFPPPTNGYSAITSAFSELLAETHQIARYDISPATAERGLEYHARRIFRTARAIVGLVQRRLAGYRDLYLAVESGYGLIYTITICAAARALGLRTYMHHHSFRYILERSTLMRVVQWISKGRGSHIFLCDCMADDFMRKYGRAVAAIRLSNMAFVTPDSDQDVPLRSNRPITIGHLSNLTREKGLYHFVALAKAARLQGLACRFLLAGPAYAAADRAAIETACAELGDGIEYRGALYGESKNEFYRDIDVFAFPSEYVNEAQPLVVFEALSAGALVIAYDRGCIAEQVCADGVVVPRNQDFSTVALEWLNGIATDRDGLDLRRAAVRQRMQREHCDARAQAPAMFGPIRTGLHRPRVPMIVRVRQGAYDLLRLVGGELLLAMAGSPFISDAEDIATRRTGSPPDRVLRATIAKFPPKMIERGVAFIHIPKNAGTSVNEALYGRSFGHLTAQYLSRLNPAIYDSLETLAIVRDPIQRAISGYYHVIQAGGDEVRLHPCWRRRLSYIRTFDDYLAYLQENGSGLDKLEFVVRPQSAFVCDENGNELVRNIFVLGEDDREIEAFLARHGAARLPYRNKTARLAISVTEAHRAILNRLYAPDLALIERVRGTRGPAGAPTENR